MILLQTNTVSKTLESICDGLIPSAEPCAYVDQSVLELLGSATYTFAGGLSKLVESHSALNSRKILT